MDSGKRPKISIVVPAYNAEKTLSDCLDSLLSLDFPKEDREILVVDNNSTDHTKDIILKYSVTYLFEPNKGRGWARNKGINYAQGEFIAFIDSDCIATKKWLTILLHAISQDKNIAICGGKIVTLNEETIFEQYAQMRDFLSQEKGIEGEGYGHLPRVVTANTLFRKTVLEEVGYFDEDLVTSEDTELSWRVCFLGYKIKYVPQAIVHHQHIQTFSEFCQHQFEYGKAAAVLRYKYEMCHSKLYVLAGAILSIIKILFVLIFQTIQFVCLNKGQKKIQMLYVAGIERISYHLGMFTFTLVMLLNNKKYKGLRRKPLDNPYKELTIYENGERWSLDASWGWFLKKDLVNLIALSQGLTMYCFNESATKIWLSLINTRDFQKTLDEITGHYDISRETVMKDMNDFIRILKIKEILKKT